jgi:hypothetical protein
VIGDALAARAVRHSPSMAQGCRNRVEKNPPCDARALNRKTRLLMMSIGIKLALMTVTLVCFAGMALALLH